MGSAAILLWSSTTFAAESAAEAEEDELAEVQVTGTRIQVKGNYNSSNPITSISGEEMRQLGIVNVADALTQLVPQNLSTYTDFAVSDTRSSMGAGTPDEANRGQYFIGNTIANLRGLDPAFGSRTLTLIDGRRTVSTSTQADVVDLNIIPSNLLERMDVVTGGASATYGSGAMAGVVNLVLARRLTGINLDMDYGVNEAGDGGSPHVSLSGGTPLFGGKGHILLGGEWQKTNAIQNCAEARSWCAQSRALFDNTTATQAVNATFTALPGYADGTYPAHFQVENVRFSQWSSNGAIVLSGQPAATSGWKFTDDGTGVAPYALGFRGGNGTGNVMNGDGPVVTAGTAMRSGNDRKTGFANFEFDFNSTTTGYLQANYAKTSGTNLNTFTTSTNCVRFQTPGVAAATPVTAPPGKVFKWNATNLPAFAGWATAAEDAEARAVLSSPSFRAWLGNLPTFNSFADPYWPQFAPGAVLVPVTQPAPPYPGNNPTFNFGGRAVGHWRLGGNAVPPEYGGNWFWILDGITITDPVGYVDPGKPAVLPTTGNDSYYFLKGLSSQAVEQLQQAAVFQSSPTATVGNQASAGPAITYLTGSNPCAGQAAVRKVWSPQFRRSTENDANTVGSTLGVRGRFGSDWRWETYYQFGQTKNEAVQNNASTTIRQYYAMDAVTDTRTTVMVNGASVANPNFGKAVCRVTRDGVPTLSLEGRQVSNVDALKALAVGCQPLNIFGSNYSGDALAQQQAAIDYAFVENLTKGKTTQQTLSINTSGTLWSGIGAGPLASAFGLELRDNKLDNSGSQGNYYERFDIASGWSDKFGGRTSLAEGFTELNMPIVSGIDGLNLLALNVGLRHSIIRNKGAAGTTGQSVTQHTTNWKFATDFSPFDWVRMRMTRSRDMRAAGYRDLFISQPTPGGPDFLTGSNPWREYSAESTEGRVDRWGTINTGNANLKPEKSDTMTLGIVLSPGGWAQGMRMSVDYYDIKVKDGIFTAYYLNDPINVCWRESGNNDPGRNRFGDLDPTQAGVNGNFDANNAACRSITFAEELDANGNAIPGTRNLQDIVNYNYGAPDNGLPFQRRGLDLALNYNFPLNRAFESLPGSVALTVRGQRALEASGYASNYAVGAPTFTRYDLVGQIRSNQYIPGISATPEWQGNVSVAYLLGGFTSTLRATYVGPSVIDKQWADEPGQANYQNSSGVFLFGSVDDNNIKQYMNFALSGTYDLKIQNTKQFQIFGSINNLFDKSPPWTAGYLSGANPQYADTMGRAYRMGVRLKF